MTHKRSRLHLVFCALAAYMIQSHLSGINPAIYSLAAAFPDYATETIFLVSTLASLGTVPACFASGWVVRRIGYRRTAIAAISVFLLATTLPIALSHFTAILVLRGVVGLAAGLILPMGPSLVAAYFPLTEQRSKLLGWGSIAGNLTGIALSVSVGYLVALSVRLFWLVNLIMLIPLAAAILMPEPERGTAPPRGPRQSAGIPRQTWLFILLFPLALIFYWPFVLNLSHLVAELGGAPIQAGYAFTLSTAGGLLYGLLFGRIYKRLRQRSFALACASIFLLFVICAFTRQIWLLYLSVFAGGFTMYAIFIDLGITSTATAETRVRAVGINMAAANLAIFASGWLHPWLGSLLGQEENVRFLFYPGIVFFAACAIWFFVRPPRIRKSPEPAAEDA